MEINLASKQELVQQENEKLNKFLLKEKKEKENMRRYPNEKAGTFKESKETKDEQDELITE